MSSASDKQRRDRIVSHMNANHTRELSHYLQHYCGASYSASRSAHLQDLSLRSLIIQAPAPSGPTYTVSFDPPLQSWDEIRPRVVEMDRVARQHLGISDVYITEHKWPDEFVDITLFGAVVFYVFCFLSLPWFVPGSRPWELMSRTLGIRATQWYPWLVKTIVVPVIAIHATEAVYFEKRRMRRHGVERWSGLWWKWMICVSVEGYTAWKRIGKVIKRAELQKEAKAH